MFISILWRLDLDLFLETRRLHMRINRSVVPFKGNLQTLVAKRFGSSLKLSEKEKQEYLKENIEPPKTRRVRRKELDGLFRVYASLVQPDEFVIQLLNRATRCKNVTVGLVDKFDMGVRYLRQKFESMMFEDFLVSAKRIHKSLEGLEETVNELLVSNEPIDTRMVQLREFVRKPLFKKVLGDYAEIMSSVFKLMGIPVSTRMKRNAALNISYTQFALATALESALSTASKSVEEEFVELKKAVSLNLLELDNKLAGEGLIVRKVRDYYSTQDSAAVSFITIAYRPEMIQEIGHAPTPPKKGDLTEAEYAKALSRYKEDAKDYSAKSQQYIVGIYSPYEKTPNGEEYRRYLSLDEYHEDLAVRKAKEKILVSAMPKVTSKKVQVGTTESVDEAGNPVSTPIFEHLSEITFSSKKVEPFTLQNYDLSQAFGAVATSQVTDGVGTSPSGITRIYKTRSIIVDDRQQPVIIEGRYKGFLLEDMVNITGRLIEGSSFVKMKDGSKKEIQLLDDVYVQADEKGTPRKTSLKEVSFLEIGQGDKGSKFSKVLENRLIEPYITVSADKTRLVLGIPSGESSKSDRHNIKALAEIMPGVTQKKDPRLAPTTNGLNPFYYLDAPSYEAIRDTLGSVTLSKSAVEFLERYYKELLLRDRALNEENVARFKASEIGGFVSEVNGRPFEFNNKQMEAMAWMEANGYSGLMALDTGVGKTLLAGGAMNHYIRHKEASGAKGKFLFVSPKRLQGDFTREMSTYMSEKGLIESRVEEMNYNKFALIVRGIDTLAETLKLDADKRLKKLAVLPSDFWDKPKEFKGPRFKTASEYFQSKYTMCFFDEVNEALTGTKGKAISELKHPRKILLTASSMERDPLDLYRFVSIAKGEPTSKPKERGFAERFGNVIGGRFVGIKNDAPVRAEFNTWVKANAYFADKQDVNLEEIGLPKLLVPTEQVVSIRMDAEVQKEYRKLSKDVSRELKAMVKKYRDIQIRGKKTRSNEFGEGKATIQDFAISSLKRIKDLITLSTNPGKYFGKRDYPNPKLDEANKILLDRPGKSICYFCSDSTVVRANAIRCSASGVGGIHAALLDNKIEFFRDAKSLGSIEKKTGRSEILKLDTILRTASLNLDYSFIKDPKLLDSVRDLKEMVEFNMEKYNDALEIEELKDITAVFNAYVAAIRSKDLAKVRATRRSLDTAYYKIFDFETDQWAINATKSLFKSNPNIKTVSCTDAYAKGFNFQFISTVVHLDRGEGFDSELVKQRTARAYRTGQDKQVEVIYLDSMIDATKPPEVDDVDGESRSYANAEDISIDELKNIVQSADQTFFQDVIDQAAQTNLVDNYEKVRRTTGKLMAMNKNLFAMVLKPTAVSLAEAQAKLNEEDRLPLKTSSLNPHRFTDNEVFKKAIEQNASIQNVSADVLRDTCDLVGISTLAEHQFDDSSSVTITQNNFSSTGKFVSMEAQISKSKEGSLTVHTTSFKTTKCAPKDIGNRMVFAQISSALINKNVKALKGDSTGDHMLLPRLGYDGVISLPFLTQPDEVLSDDQIIIKNWLTTKDRIIGNDKTHVSDLFLVTDKAGVLVGQYWWKENGTPLTGLTLSLNEHSTGMRLLNLFFKMKCASLGTTPSKYLATAIEPFDIYNPSCWADYMSGMRTPEEVKNLITYVNVYKTAFRQAYYTSADVRSVTPDTLKKRFRLKEAGFESLVVSDVSPSPSAEDPFKQSKDPILDEAWKAISKMVGKVADLKEERADKGDFNSVSKIESTLDIVSDVSHEVNSEVSSSSLDLGNDVAIENMLNEVPAEAPLEDATVGLDSTPTQDVENDVSFIDEQDLPDFDPYAVDDEENN
jgi:hypothetical protein